MDFVGLIYHYSALIFVVCMWEVGYECFQVSEESSQNFLSVKMIISSNLGLYSSLGCVWMPFVPVWEAQMPKDATCNEGKAVFVTMPLEHRTYKCLGW